MSFFSDLPDWQLKAWLKLKWGLVVIVGIAIFRLSLVLVFFLFTGSIVIIASIALALLIFYLCWRGLMLMDYAIEDEMEKRHGKDWRSYKVY